jgi:hypothetical protein
MNDELLNMNVLGMANQNTMGISPKAQLLVSRIATAGGEPSSAERHGRVAANDPTAQGHAGFRAGRCSSRSRSFAGTWVSTTPRHRPVLQPSGAPAPASASTLWRSTVTAALGMMAQHPRNLALKAAFPIFFFLSSLLYNGLPRVLLVPDFELVIPGNGGAFLFL